jgi:hypothetical protein
MAQALSATGRGHARVRAIFGAAVMLLMTATTASAQAPKIWDIAFGTPVASLPLDQFVDPACGTSGGPPARVLKSFTEFAQCARERTTGLHEVWFRYDDEMEYVARARRSDIMIRQYQANSMAGQPIITSLLIDGAGLVQGLSDRRSTRRIAHAACRVRPRRSVQGHCRAWPQLHQLPLAEGETADRRLVRQGSLREECGRADLSHRTRRYFKAGQYAVDPNENRLTENLFESSARIEVYKSTAP